MAGIVADSNSVVAGSNSVVAERPPVVAGSNSVVAERPPVVAGQASSSSGEYNVASGVGESDNPHNADGQPVVAGFDGVEVVSFCDAASHIDDGNFPNVMEAGDLPLFYPAEYEQHFGPGDWREKGTTLMKGDWGVSPDGPVGNKRDAFGIENQNFGQKRRDSAALMQACKKIRESGAQLWTLQEAVPILMDAVLQQGEVEGDSNRVLTARCTTTDAVSRTTALTYDVPAAEGYQAGQAASSSDTPAVVAATADPPPAKPKSHKIYWVSFDEGTNADNNPIPTVAFAGRSSHVQGIRMLYFRRFSHGTYNKSGKEKKKSRRLDAVNHSFCDWCFPNETVALP